MKKIKLSAISMIHYFKLIFRSMLFAAALAIYIINRSLQTGETFGGLEDNRIILGIIWVVFVLEMVLRFFPSGMESMGCQKQFEKNFIATKEKTPKLQPRRVTALVALLWLLLNAIFGVLYFLGVIDQGILLLIALAFSVCDMICILFFCPFQTWFMKNKCCGSCRIYNWDYAMMFTPLVFVHNPYSLSLVAIAVALLMRWEVGIYLHPERFAENTNACLSCANCPEKLCHHKKQLRGFLKRNMQALRLKGNAILDGIKKSEKRTAQKEESDSQNKEEID